MSRPRLTIGTFGEIGFQSTASGRVSAYARYRDWDGITRVVQATAATEKTAERVLKAKLAERSLFQPADTLLTPDSSFEDLADYWLADLELEDHLAKSTKQRYERNMRTLVVPVFKGRQTREISRQLCCRAELAGEGSERSPHGLEVERSGIPGLVDPPSLDERIDCLRGRFGEVGAQGV